MVIDVIAFWLLQAWRKKEELFDCTCIPSFRNYARYNVDRMLIVRAKRSPLDRQFSSISICHEPKKLIIDVNYLSIYVNIKKANIM